MRGDPLPIHNNTFDEAYERAQVRVEVPGLEIFDDTRVTRIQAAHFQMAVDRRLMRYRGPMLDRLFLECIEIHRILNTVGNRYEREPPGSKRHAGRAKGILGTMLQQRLTLVMLMMRQGLYDRFYRFGLVRGVSEDRWQKNVAGAAAAARVARAMLRIRGMDVYFASTTEDLDMGIDLIGIRQQGPAVAVGVKTNGTDQLYTLRGTADEQLARDEERFWAGTTQMSTFYDREFKALVARVQHLRNQHDADLVTRDAERVRNALSKTPKKRAGRRGRGRRGRGRGRSAQSRTAHDRPGATA